MASCIMLCVSPLVCVSPFDCVTLGVCLILQDANPLGEILLGSPSQGYSVEEECPPEYNAGEYAFVLVTPIRSYPLIPEEQTAEEKARWVECLRHAIEKDSGESCAMNGASTYETE